MDAGDEARHARRYAIQLRLYALALERHLGVRPRRAVVWYLRTETAVDVSLHRAALDEARATLRRLREAQHAIDFPLRAGDHCVRCEFFQNACPAAIAEPLALPAE